MGFFDQLIDFNLAPDNEEKKNKSSFSLANIFEKTKEQYSSVQERALRFAYENRQDFNPVYKRGQGNQFIVHRNEPTDFKSRPWGYQQIRDNQGTVRGYFEIEKYEPVELPEREFKYRFGKFGETVDRSVSSVFSGATKVAGQLPFVGDDIEEYAEGVGERKRELQFELRDANFAEAISPFGEQNTGTRAARLFTGKDPNEMNPFAGAALEIAFDPWTYVPLAGGTKAAKSFRWIASKMPAKTGILPRIAAALLEPITASPSRQLAFELGAGYGGLLSARLTDELMQEYFPDAPGYVRTPLILATALPGALLGGKFASGIGTTAFTAAFDEAAYGLHRAGERVRILSWLDGSQRKINANNKARAKDAIESFDWSANGDQLVFTTGKPDAIGQRLPRGTRVHHNASMALTEAGDDEVLLAVKVTADDEYARAFPNLVRDGDDTISVKQGWTTVENSDSTTVMAARHGSESDIEDFDAWVGSEMGYAHGIQQRIAEANEAAYSVIDPEGVRLAHGEIIPGRPYRGQADEFKPATARDTEDIGLWLTRAREAQSKASAGDFADAGLGLPGGMRFNGRVLFGDKSPPGTIFYNEVTPDQVITLREVLEDLTWNKSGSDLLESFYKPFHTGAEAFQDPRNVTPENLEKLRDAVINRNLDKMRGFEQPLTVPMGDYKIRAAELLQELDDDLLNEELPFGSALEAVAALVNKRDIDNWIAAHGHTWDDVLADELYKGSRKASVPRPEDIDYDDTFKAVQRNQDEAIMYHGTNGNVTEPSIGMYLTPNPNDAQLYAEAAARLSGGEPRVIEVVAKKNVLRSTDDVAGSRGAVFVTDPSEVKMVYGPAFELPVVEGKRVPRSKADPFDLPLDEANKFRGGEPPAGEPLFEYEKPAGVPDEVERIPKYLKPIADIEEQAAQVKGSDNALIRTIVGKTGINPSVLQNTDLGRTWIGYIRGTINAVKNVEIALNAAIDAHNPITGLGEAFGKGGRIFNVDKRGVVKGTGVHWADIFSNPNKYSDVLNSKQRQYIDDFNQTIDDAKLLLDYYGIKVNIDEIEKGARYVPRFVESIDNIEALGRSNPELKRLYELATEAIEEGVRYENPRETSRLFMTWAMDKITRKMLDDSVMRYSLSTDEVINQSIRTRLRESIENLDDARRERNELSARLSEEPKNKDLKAMLNKKRREVRKLQFDHKQARKEYNAEKSRLEKGGQIFKFDPFATDNPRIFGANVEGNVPLKFWRNRWVNQVDWEKFDSTMQTSGLNPGKPANIFAKSAEWLANNIRLGSTGFDFAAPFMQGLPSIQHPIRWSKATFVHYRNFFLPGAYARMIRSELETLTEMSRYGVTIGEAEAFAALEGDPGSLKPLGGQLDKFARKIDDALPETPGKGIARGIVRIPSKQALARFQASYNTFLTKLRVETWKANKRAFEGNEHELGRFINNITGGLNVKALGVSNNQRRLESFWLALSPRFLRSTLALGLQAMQPGTQGGRLAARELAGSAAVFTFAYIGISTLMQEMGMDLSDDDIIQGLNPLSGKRFLSIKVGDQYVGVGGQVRALIQLGAGLASNTVVEPEKNLKLDWYENPIVSFWSSRAAPGARLVLGGVEAATEGEVDALPYEELNTPIDLASFVGSSTLPFALQGALFEGQDFTQTILDQVGFRTSPFNRTEQINFDVKQFAEEKGWMKDPQDISGIAGLGHRALDFIQEQTGLGDDVSPLYDPTPKDRYEELNNEQKAEFKEEFPFSRTTRNDPVTNYFSEVKALEIEFVNDVIIMSEVTKNNPDFNKIDFREWHDTRRQEYYNRLDQLRLDFDNVPAERTGFDGSVTDYLDSRDVLPEDKAVNDYYNLYDSARIAPAAGAPVDFEKLDRIRGEFLNSLPQEVKEYVQRQTQGGDREFSSDVEADLYFAREVTKEYWEADEVVFNAFRQQFTDFAQYSSLEEFEQQIATMAQQYGLTPETMLAFSRESSPAIKTLYDTISNYKEYLRLTNPELDIALYEWYDIEPADRIGYTLWQFGQNDPSTAVLASMLQGRQERVLALQAGASLRNRGLQPSYRRSFNRRFELSGTAENINFVNQILGA